MHKSKRLQRLTRSYYGLNFAYLSHDEFEHFCSLSGVLIDANAAHVLPALDVEACENEAISYLTDCVDCDWSRYRKPETVTKDMDSIVERSSL